MCQNYSLEQKPNDGKRADCGIKNAWLKVGLLTREEGRGQQIVVSKANYKTVQNCQSKSANLFKALEINQSKQQRGNHLFMKSCSNFRWKQREAVGFLPGAVSISLPPLVVMKGQAYRPARNVTGGSIKYLLCNSNIWILCKYILNKHVSQVLFSLWRNLSHWGYLCFEQAISPVPSFIQEYLYTTLAGVYACPYLAIFYC